MEGRIIEIYTASKAGAAMDSKPFVQAMAGRGLAGDRYLEGSGTYSHYPGAHDVTLFALESLWDFEGAYGIQLHPEQTRRNLLTEGVNLEHLLDTEFTIGEVRLRGLKPCPPCLYLAYLLKMPEILKGLARSGGIYASILSNGVIKAGDVVTVPLPEAPQEGVPVPGVSQAFQSLKIG